VAAFTFLYCLHPLDIVTWSVIFHRIEIMFWVYNMFDEYGTVGLRVWYCFVFIVQAF
jgi:hypothetical protein